MGTHGGPGITAQGQEEPERETQGDAEETPAGTPEADLFPACVRFEIVASFFMWRWTATVWIICWGLLIGICVFMHFKSMSTTGFTDKVFAVCYGEACSVRLFCTLITFSQLPHVDMWNFFGGGGQCTFKFLPIGVARAKLLWHFWRFCWREWNKKRCWWIEIVFGGSGERPSCHRLGP